MSQETIDVMGKAIQNRKIQSGYLLLERRVRHEP